MKCIQFVLLLSVSLTNRASAEQSQPNEQKYLKYQRILQQADDSIKCARLIHYANRLTDSLNDYDLSLLIFERVNSILKERRYPSLALDLACKWAYTHYQAGNYEAADKFYVQALGYGIINKNKVLKADILNKAGANLQNLSAFKRAMVYYNEAIELYTNLNDDKGKAMVYLNMANVFAMTGNLNQSDLFFDKSMGLFLQHNDQEKYMVALANKGIIKWKLGKLAEAKALLVRSVQPDLKTVKGFDHFIVMHFNLGLIYSELRRWDSCFYYLEKGKKIADSLHMWERFDGSYFFDLGYCYVKKGEIKKAISCYKHALKTKTGIASYRTLYDNISELYAQMKQYDTAFYYKNQSLLLADSIYKSEMKEHIDFQNKRVELLEKDYQNQIRAAEQERSLGELKKKNYLLLCILAILVILVLLFLVYFKQYRLRQKKEHLQGELDFLKAQLNPHFLFNSINNIYVLLDENKDKASHILLKFSDLMRYQLYECNVSAILLNKELNFLKNYIAFEKLRYSNKVIVEDNLESLTVNDLKIAPLLLQPFIENAFKHVPKGKSAQSRIEIDVSLHHEQLLFKINNSRDLTEVSGLPGGVGLDNVKKRLKLLYPGKHELNITATEDHFSVVLKLKLAHD